MDRILLFGVFEVAQHCKKVSLALVVGSLSNDKKFLVFSIDGKTTLVGVSCGRAKAIERM